MEEEKEAFQNRAGSAATQSDSGCSASSHAGANAAGTPMAAENSTPSLQPLQKRKLEKLHVLPIGHKAADREVFAVLKKMMADDVLLQQYLAFEVPVRGTESPGELEMEEPSRAETSTGNEANTLSSCTYIVVDCCPRSGYVGTDTLVFLAGKPLQPLRRVQLLALVHPNSSYAHRAGIHTYQQLFEQAPSFPSLDRQEPYVEDSAAVYTLSSVNLPSTVASTRSGHLLSPFTPAFLTGRQAGPDEEFPFGFTDIIEDLESASSNTSTSDDETGGLGAAPPGARFRGPDDCGRRGFSLQGPTVPRLASRGDVTEVGEGDSSDCSGVTTNGRPESFESQQSAASSSTRATEGRRGSRGSGDSRRGPEIRGFSAGCSSAEAPPSQNGEDRPCPAGSNTEEQTRQSVPVVASEGDTSLSRRASAAERRRLQRRRLQHSQFFEAEPSAGNRRRGRLPGTIRVRLRERMSAVHAGGLGSGVCRSGKRLDRLDPETLFREFVGPYLSSRMYGRRGRTRSTIVLYPGKKLVVGDLTFVVWATDPRNSPGFVDENTSIYISLDPYGEFKRVHFVPFSDTLPTTYRFDFYDDYLKPFLLENTWRNFTRGDVYSYRGVEFKLIATEPVSSTIARVGPETTVYYQGTVEPTIMDLLPPDILHRIRRLPVRLQPFAVVSAAQALDPQVLMRVIPAASIRGPRQGINEQMVEVLRDRLVHPFSFVAYLRAFRDLCERKLPSEAKREESQQRHPDVPADSPKRQDGMDSRMQDNGPQESSAGVTNISEQPSEAEKREVEQTEDKASSVPWGMVHPTAFFDAASFVCETGHEGGPSEERRTPGEEKNPEKSSRQAAGVTGDEGKAGATVSPNEGAAGGKPSPSLCEDEFERPSCTVCTLTLEEGDLSIVLPCGHVFHWQCAHAWLRCNSTCPNCRADINVLLKRDNGEGSESGVASRLRRSTRERLQSDRQGTDWHRRSTVGEQENRPGGLGDAFRSWFGSILS
ncbi:hypothetical protein NCLIV_042900 [Neospora caninum Liverpool]|uniref:RING-type E3 ubiquitin transferase n=1 Tax=Neospora caninum (strain Liverpool) TaxID=572307 RepID=F0VC89_NEOCL|nr:hypothetical protein NCLIV_042900 [Neospora caninum Liverpool]CBZ51223.1 hypothetical protein NCLIV_042900 [Neospora caninum Liverpool]CEL68537.1 TPA: RING-H2 finger protein ATL5 [Neospora caninum Liverpool]|eukprot:XP_003881256.1 hypothetical protein NCLIV_042900 [Neospora caninum Liverpool]